MERMGGQGEKERLRTGMETETGVTTFDEPGRKGSRDSDVRGGRRPEGRWDAESLANSTGLPSGRNSVRFRRQPFGLPNSRIVGI